MPVWKVLLILLLGIICLALALSTIVIPMTFPENRWLWLAGLLVATIVMSTLLTLFLKNADKTFKR